MYSFNLFLHKGKRRVKTDLTNNCPGVKLVFKEGQIKLIRHIKGWKNDAEMARALGITRAYMSMLAKRRCNVSHTVITRLAYLIGSLNGKWWVHYELIDAGDPIDPNHPLFNEEKYQGRIPYARHSISADFRSKDYAAESVRKEYLS